MKGAREESSSSSMDVEQGSEQSYQGEEAPKAAETESPVEPEAKEEDEHVIANGRGASPQEDSDPVKKDITFRMGYMGHVIIICQALVHACGAMDQIPGTSEGNTEGKDLAGSKNNMNGQPNLVSEHGEESGIASSPASRNMILTLLRSHRHYKAWLNFVTTTLASETAVQTIPLGGFNAQEELNAAEQLTESTVEDSDDGLGGQFEDDSDIKENTDFGTFVVHSGDIDLDDVDVDLAASMMESMNINPNESEPSSNEGSGQPKGHRKQKGVIGCGGVNGTSFGTVVEMHKKPDEYVYDDPLGTRPYFDDDDMNNSSNEKESEENGDTDNTDGDEEAPVMDLFAGNFDFEKTNIDAYESDDVEGWANFDDGDFASAMVEDSGMESVPEFDIQNDPFDTVSDSSNIISSLENIDDKVGIEIDEQKVNGQVVVPASEEQ